MISCHYKERHGLIQDLVRCYSGGINGRTIVFAETKIDCDEVCGAIGRELGARAIHGDIPQQQREVWCSDMITSKVKLFNHPLGVLSVVQCVSP